MNAKQTIATIMKQVARIRGSVAQIKETVSNIVSFPLEDRIAAGTGPLSVVVGVIEDKEIDVDGYSTPLQASVASGILSYAEGAQTKASGMVSHAEGAGAQAIGIGSHAENAGKAIGNFSHAEGQGQASGAYSHAEGGSSTSATAAHAEGVECTAAGWSSHAEGNKNTSAGAQSHAEGSYNTTEAAASHVEGGGNAVGDKNPFIHVSGVYADVPNVETQHEVTILGLRMKLGQYAEVIGNGASQSAKSNARTLDWDGNAWYAGNVTAAGGSLTLGQTSLSEVELNAIKAAAESSTVIYELSQNGGQFSVTSCNKTFAEISQLINQGKLGRVYAISGNDFARQRIDLSIVSVSDSLITLMQSVAMVVGRSVSVSSYTLMHSSDGVMQFSFASANLGGS